MENRRLILFSSIHLISRKPLPLGRENKPEHARDFTPFQMNEAKKHLFLFCSGLPCWLSVVLIVVFPWYHSVSFFWCTFPHRKQLFDSSAGVSTTVPMPAISYYPRMWFSTVQRASIFLVLGSQAFSISFVLGQVRDHALGYWLIFEVVLKCVVAWPPTPWTEKNVYSISGWLFSSEFSQHNSFQIKVMIC